MPPHLQSLDAHRNEFSAKTPGREGTPGVFAVAVFTSEPERWAWLQERTRDVLFGERLA
jgi:hypothetical protein